MGVSAIKTTSAHLHRLIVDFLGEFSKISVPERYNRLGNEFIHRFAPERGLEIASALSFANPLFLPDIPEESVANLKISLEQFGNITFRAKLTAKHSRQQNVLVACAPKSASTFIQHALQVALDLPVSNLFTASVNPSALGANLQEQELDELALIRSGLNGQGYVAQHHMRCSPYAAKLLKLYNIRPIVTIRNIFDTLVSLDDMLLDWHQTKLGGDRYFDDAMPKHYFSMDVDDRMTLLSTRWSIWLTQFYLSWKKCERYGQIKPFWISYERDFLGDKMALAERLADYLGEGRDDGLAERLVKSFQDQSQGKALRINKGVSGRGDNIAPHLRAQVLKIIGYYGDEEDMSPLIGD